MRFLRNLPIGRKLTVITVAISGVSLLFACAGFAIYEQVALRDTMARDFAILTDIFDDNVASGLAFNDPASIEQTLATLSAHQRILAAAVYDKQDRIVAQYRRASSTHDFEFPTRQLRGQRFGPERLDTFKDVVLADEVIGVVYISASLDELRERAWLYAGIVGVLLVACSLVALLLTARFQRIVSGPIVDLARIVATVTADKNYAVRAHKQSDDELGRLIEGFNEMLVQIQARDVALQSAHDKLEGRVRERTHELQQEVAERRRSEEALRVSHQRFEIVARATSDVVWDWHLEPDTLWFNENYQLQFASGADQVPRTSAGWTAGIHPEDLAGVKQSLKATLEGSGQIWTAEYRFRRNDGSYAAIHDRGWVMRDSRGQPWRMIGAMQDITERKEAAARLAETHKQLLDTSRQAGMAEVATGVLHNVGNVLNSVNVSATLVMDRVRESKMVHVPKLGELLQAHAPDLVNFLTNDPKGRRIPGYLLSLSADLALEQSSLVEELGHLRNNIEHIKEIVAMQQNYAKVSGVTETVAVTELVDDALRMNESALSRHRLDVVRDFAARPTLTLDRHKVLQILVNVIRNAKYACDESGRTDKQMTVRVTQDDHCVRIAVIDNGVGISVENLTRIFAHGFTTRKTGHGFGLHSGALAASELGGSLIAQSDGPGKGATFVLELPFKAMGS